MVIPKPHHLYEIVDKTDNDTVKYGISSDELTSDGFSPRAEKQVKNLNVVVGWLRFFSRILLTEIPERVKAKEIENQFIEEYTKANGEKPREICSNVFI